MANPYVPFESDSIYHVYNRGNGGEKIFRQHDNYLFFLRKFEMYICPVAKIYSYCLIPNHFHFLLRIKTDKTLQNFAQIKYSGKAKEIGSEKIISEQFKNFLISYSKSFNKYYNRKGNLFQKNLKRIKISSDEYYTNMIRYIHFNPVFHGLRNHPSEWSYSSYLSFYKNNKNTLLQKDDVLDWFGGLHPFKQFHRRIQENEIKQINHLTFE